MSNNKDRLFQDGRLLKEIDKPTIDECFFAVGQNGMALEFVPKHLRSIYLYEQAVQNDGLSLQFVPEEARVPSLCKLAVSQNGKAIAYVSSDKQTVPLCQLAVQRDARAIAFCDETFLTNDICKMAIKKDPLLLEYVPENLQSYDLCKLAILNDWRALQFVIHPNERLCAFAIAQDEAAWQYVDESVVNVRLLNEFFGMEQEKQEEVEETEKVLEQEVNIDEEEKPNEVATTEEVEGTIDLEKQARRIEAEVAAEKEKIARLKAKKEAELKRFRAIEEQNRKAVEERYQQQIQNLNILYSQYSEPYKLEDYREKEKEINEQYYQSIQSVQKEYEQASQTAEVTYANTVNKIEGRISDLQNQVEIKYSREDEQNRKAVEVGYHQQIQKPTVAYSQYNEPYKSENYRDKEISEPYNQNTQSVQKDIQQANQSGEVSYVNSFPKTEDHSFNTYKHEEMKDFTEKDTLSSNSTRLDRTAYDGGSVSYQTERNQQQEEKPIYTNSEHYDEAIHKYDTRTQLTGQTNELGQMVQGKDSNSDSEVKASSKDVLSSAALYNSETYEQKVDNLSAPSKQSHQQNHVPTNESSSSTSNGLKGPNGSFNVPLFQQGNTSNTSIASANGVTFFNNGLNYQAIHSKNDHQQSHAPTNVSRTNISSNIMSSSISNTPGGMKSQNGTSHTSLFQLGNLSNTSLPNANGVTFFNNSRDYQTIPKKMGDQEQAKNKLMPRSEYLRRSEIADLQHRLINAEYLGQIVNYSRRQVLNAVQKEESGAGRMMRSSYRTTADVFVTAQAVSNVNNLLARGKRTLGKPIGVIERVGDYARGENIKALLRKSTQFRDDGTFGLNVKEKALLQAKYKELKKPEKLLKTPDFANQKIVVFNRRTGQLTTRKMGVPRLIDLNRDISKLKWALKHVKLSAKEKAAIIESLKLMNEQKIAIVREQGNRAFGHMLIRRVSNELRKGDDIGVSLFLDTSNMMFYRNTRYMIKQSIKNTGTILGTGILKITRTEDAYKAVKKQVNARINQVKQLSVYQKEKVRGKIRNTLGKNKQLKKLRDEINGGIYNRLRKGISNHVPAGVHRVASKFASPFRWTKHKLLAFTKNKWVKGTGTVVKSILSAPRKLIHMISSAMHTFKMFLLKLGGYVITAMLLCFVIVSIVNAVVSAATSVIFGPEEVEGKTDLTPYVDVLNEAENEFWASVHNLTSDSKYDDVVYYHGRSSDPVDPLEITFTTNNYKEIISMAAVYFEQDLRDEDKVANYMKQLYSDSHKVNYRTEEYTCEGCKEREYHCYDTLPKDGTASEERKKLHKEHAANDGCKKQTKVNVKTVYLSDYDVNVPSSHPTNKSFLYNEMEFIYENGHWVAHVEETSVYYTCPGHKEKYCVGHTRLHVSINTLHFDNDAIFEADSIANAQTLDGIAGDSLGLYTLTAYCQCEVCCGKWSGGPTASGVFPIQGRTIAVDPRVIPLGTHVVIKGKEYIAEDTGSAIKGNRIDVFFKSHKEALQFGKQTDVPVYLATASDKAPSNEEEDKTWTGWTKDLKDIVKNIAKENWENLYYGWDNEAMANGTYSYTVFDVDWDQIEIEDGPLTKKQKKLIEIATHSSDYGIVARSGYCQAWVADVYAPVIGKRISSASANSAAKAWGWYTDISQIKPGATIYGKAIKHGGEAGRKWGHVGIYIGNGKVISNEGKVVVRSLKEWVTFWEAYCWGWNSGKDLSRE